MLRIDDDHIFVNVASVLFPSTGKVMFHLHSKWWNDLMCVCVCVNGNCFVFSAIWNKVNFLEMCVPYTDDWLLNTIDQLMIMMIIILIVNWHTHTHNSNIDVMMWWWQCHYVPGEPCELVFVLKLVSFYLQTW